MPTTVDTFRIDYELSGFDRVLDAHKKLEQMRDQTERANREAAKRFDREFRQIPNRDPSGRFVGGRSRSGDLKVEVDRKNVDLIGEIGDSFIADFQEAIDQFNKKQFGRGIRSLIATPASSIGRGFFEAIGGRFGQQYATGLDKIFKRELGFSAEGKGRFAAEIGIGAGRGIFRSVQSGDPRDLIRELVQTRRRNQVLDESISQAKRLAREANVNVAADKPNVFVVGGIAGAGGHAGVRAKKDLRNAFGKGLNVIPVKNPNTDTPFSIRDDPRKALPDIYFKQFQNLFGKGYNPDAVNLAAQVFAARQKDSKAKISMLGHSGGGYVVEEAQVILDQLGIKDVRGIGLGTPDLGFGYGSKGYREILGETDRIVQNPAVAALLQRSGQVKNIGSLGDLSSHDLDDYLKHPEVIKAIGIGGDGEVQALINSFSSHFEGLIKRRSLDPVTVNKMLQTPELLEGIDPQTLMPLSDEKLKSEIYKVKEVLTRLNKQFSGEHAKAFAEIGDAYDELLDTVLKTPQNKAAQGQAQKAPQNLLAEYQKYLDSLIKKAADSAQKQIKTLAPNYDQLSIPERSQKAGEFVAEIADEVKQFRTAIKNGDRETARALGESILKKTQAVRKVYKDLQEQVSAPASLNKLKARQGQLTAIETEVRRGQPNQNGRAEVGLEQLVQRAVADGGDVSEGFLGGVRASLDDARRAGVELGQATTEGAEGELEIASPSKRFERIGKWVVEGFKRGTAGIRGAVGNVQQQINQGVGGQGQPQKNWFGRMVDSLRDGLSQLEGKFPILKKIKAGILQVGIAAASAIGLYSLGDFMIDLSRQTFDAAQQFELLEQTMAAASGSAKQGARNLQFVSDVAKKFSINLKGAEQDYQKLVSATRFTSLEGQRTDQIFEDLSQTISARGLSTYEQNRSFLAVSQIVGKEKFQGQELLQLAEIPGLGARSALSRSLGISGPQLAKSLQRGDVSAENLSQFAAQLAADSAGVAGGADTATAALNRLDNAFVNLQRDVGGTFLPGTKTGINLLTGAIEGLRSIVEPTKKVINGLILLLGIKLVGAFKGAGTGATAFQKILLALFNFLQANLLRFAKFAVTIGFAIVAMESLQNAVKVARNPFKQLQDDVEATSKNLENLRSAIRELNEERVQDFDFKQPGQSLNLNEGIKVADWVGNTLDRVPLLNRLVDRDSEGDPLLNLEGVRSSLGLKTLAEKRREDFLSGVGDLSASVDALFEERPEFNTSIDRILEAEKKINRLRAKRSTFTLGDERFAESLEQERSISEEVERNRKVQATYQSGLALRSEAIKRAIADFEVQAITGDLREEDKPRLELLRRALEDVDAESERAAAELSKLPQALSAAEQAFQEISFRASGALYDLGIQHSLNRADIVQQGLQNGTGQQVIQLQLQDEDRKNLEQSITVREQERKELQALLASPLYAEPLAIIRQQQADRGIDIDNPEALESLLQSGDYDGINDYKTAIEKYKVFLEIQKELPDLYDQRSQLAQQEISAIRDLNRSVRDFFTNLEFRVKEAGLELEQAQHDLQSFQLQAKLRQSLVPGSQSFVNGLVEQVNSLILEGQRITGEAFGIEGQRLQIERERYDFNSQLEDFTFNLGGASEALKVFEQRLLGSGTGSGLPEITRIEPVAPTAAVSSANHPFQGVTDIVSLGHWLQNEGFTVKEHSAFGGVSPVHAPNSYHYYDEALDITDWRDGDWMQRTRDLVGFLDQHRELLGIAELLGPGDPGHDTHVHVAFKDKVFPALQQMQDLGSTLSQLPQPSSGGLDPKVKAFLDMVAYAEGADYNVQFSGRQFSSFADHPREIINAGGYSSDAAGRYQFLSTTWDGVARQLGLTDFSPENQDQGAVELLRQRGALDRILAGDIAGAIFASAPEWASLPTPNGNSYYGQPVKRLEDLLQVYESSLNTTLSAVPTPSSSGSGLGLVGDRVFDLKNQTLTTQVQKQQAEAQFNLENFRREQQAIQRSLSSDMLQFGRTYEQFQIQLEDFNAQYLPQSTESQIVAQQRQADQAFRGMRQQVAAQSRVMQDNLAAALAGAGSQRQIAAEYRASGNLYLQQQATELEAIAAQFEQQALHYEEAIANLQTMNSELDAAQEKARQYLEEQAEIQRQQQEITKQQTVNDLELEFAQRTNNLAAQEELEIKKLQLQTEQEILAIRSNPNYTAEEKDQLIGLQQDVLGQRVQDAQFDARERELQQKQQIANLDGAILQARAQLLQHGGLDFRANALLRENAILQEQLRYEQQILEYRRTYANQPEVLGEMLAKAEQLNALNLENIKGQFKTLGQTILDNVQPAVEQFFTDIFTNAKSLGDALRDLARNLLQTFAKMAARNLTNSLFRGLGGLFGGPNVGLAGSGGGGLFGGLFRDGGTIPNFAEGGRVLPEGVQEMARLNPGIDQAFKREGPGGVLAVFTPGEEVLSTINGEAQRYQALKNMLGGNPLEQVFAGNFRYGGTVGEEEIEFNLEDHLLQNLAEMEMRIIKSPDVQVDDPVKQSNQRPITTNTTINVSATDLNSFNKSKSQILAEMEEEQRRSTRRNRG